MTSLSSCMISEKSSCSSDEEIEEFLSEEE
jgi:hypothetical protein